MTHWFDEIKKMVMEEKARESIDKVFKSMGVESIYHPGDSNMPPRLVLKYPSGFTMDIKWMTAKKDGSNLYGLLLKDPDGHIILTKDGSVSAKFKTAKQVKLLIQKTLLETKIHGRRKKWAW